MEDKENLMDDIFFGEKVSAEAFKKTIEKILFNINEIKKLLWKNVNLMTGVNKLHKYDF